MPALSNTQNEEPDIDRLNREWRVRLHRQLDALCDDAEARKGFNGSVLFEIIWRGRRLDRFETNIRQTVSK
jgi:hypothetical protein